MAFHRGIDGSDPVRADGIARAADPREHRRLAGATRLGTGTLACPRCDAPVAPAEGGITPAQPLGCPYCDHWAAARDFLSLAEPTRPARVEVHVRLPAPRRYAGIGSRASAP